MGTTTTHRGYRIPSSTDTPDVPRDVQNLGNDIDTDINTLAALVPVKLGIVAAPLTTSTAGTNTSGTTETVDSVLGTYTFTALASIRYRVTLAGRGAAGSVANDRYSLKLRYTTNGTTPTSSSTLIAHDMTVVPIVTTGNGVDMKPHIVTFIPGAGTIKIVSSWTRVNGTGICTPTGTCELWAEAIGNV